MKRRFNGLSVGFSRKSKVTPGRSSMSMSPSTPPTASAKADHGMPSLIPVFTRATRPIRTVARAAIFFLKVFPMLPSRPVDWVTKPPVMEKVRYPTRCGQAEGDLYRPRACGPHPGIVVCLGVVPFGVDHPQVAVLGKALARAGFAALLYWSPAMRDFNRRRSSTPMANPAYSRRSMQARRKLSVFISCTT